MNSGKQKSDGLMFVHSSVDDAGLSLKAFRVLGHLYRRAGNAGHAFPAVESIAEITGLNRKTVIEALTELVDKGFVSRQPRPGKSTSYTLGGNAGSLSDEGGTQPEKRADPKNGPPPSPKNGPGGSPKNGLRR